MGLSADVLGSVYIFMSQKLLSSGRVAGNLSASAHGLDKSRQPWGAATAEGAVAPERPAGAGVHTSNDCELLLLPTRRPKNSGSAVLQTLRRPSQKHH